MKIRLTALIALAAILAAPAIASAATMSDTDTATPAPALTYPNVVIPRDQNNESSMYLFDAEHNYLANACPTVEQHPGSYSSTLDRFCRAYRG